MLIAKIYSIIHRIDMRLWIHQWSVKTIHAEPDFVKIDLVKNFRTEQALIFPHTQIDPAQKKFTKNYTLKLIWEL